MGRDKKARQALRMIKQRVRDNAFGYTDRAFREMVDAWLYEEDVRRAVSTSALAGTFRNGWGAHYVLRGFVMNEDPILLVCRFNRGRVRIIHVTRVKNPPETRDGEGPNP